jgi:steroid delta-isomerase
MSQIDPKAAAVHTYIEAFTTGDTAAVVSLYAEDATLEDPVGGEILTGRPAIADFYEKAMHMGVRLELTGPVRIAANAAAFSFLVQIGPPGGPEIDVIDVFRFNPEGKIASMQAFWGPTNLRGALLQSTS